MRNALIIFKKEIKEVIKNKSIWYNVCIILVVSIIVIKVKLNLY